MRIFQNWNPINTLENLIYVAATFLMINYLIVVPLRNDMKEIMLAIAIKDTYSIKNEFEKMRTKKGGTIVLDLTNTMSHDEMNLVPMDSIVIDTTNKKQTVWQKLFGND